MLLPSFVLSLCFSLFFFYCNSPLHPTIGSDNAMYLTMGTALSRGYAPYTQIFDHKGPVLFLIEWLAQAFTSGYSLTSVFILEVLSLTASGVLIYYLADKLSISYIVLQTAFFAILSPMTCGGNLSEEYTLPLTLSGFLITFLLFKEDGFERLPKRYFLPSLLLGLLTMTCFLTRANNALPLAALTGALTILFCIKRKWQGLLWCMLGFAAGCLIIAVPIMLWLASKGALSDAFYGAFIHNFLYSSTSDDFGRIYYLFHFPYGWISMFMAFLVCLAGLLLTIRKKKLSYLFVALCIAAAGCLAGFISHKFYFHYLMIAVPAAILGIAILLSCIRNKKARFILYGVCVLISCLVIFIEGKETKKIIDSETATLPEFTKDAQTLASYVPEEDRDSFLAYRVEPKWYVAAGMLPCMRFYFLQEILADANPAIMDEIVDTLHSEPPEWLVIYNEKRVFSPPYDPRVSDIFSTRYHFVASAGEYQLLKYNEE